MAMISPPLQYHRGALTADPFGLALRFPSAFADGLVMSSTGINEDSKHFVPVSRAKNLDLSQPRHHVIKCVCLVPSEAFAKNITGTRIVA